MASRLSKKLGFSGWRKKIQERENAQDGPKTLGGVASTTPSEGTKQQS